MPPQDDGEFRMSAELRQLLTEAIAGEWGADSQYEPDLDYAVAVQSQVDAIADGEVIPLVEYEPPDEGDDRDAPLIVTIEFFFGCIHQAAAAAGSRKRQAIAATN
jgi:hypothetical protein